MLIIRRTLALLLTACVSFGQPLGLPKQPEISAESAVVMHSSGQIVYAKNADERRLIASTTKIMTALVVLDACSADRIVSVPAAACGLEGSSAYLEPGEVCTVGQLLEGLLLASGNDAAEALALLCAGSEKTFVARMNDKAAALGLRGTHFANPHGLDDKENYSTAADLAQLMLYAMEQGTFARIVSEGSAERNGLRLYNHNKLLERCEGCLGGKTGYTMTAGRCLVSCCERGGARYACVTLSAPDDWNDQCRLYDWAFCAYTEQILDQELLFSVPVVGLDGRTVTAASPPLSVLLPRHTKLTIIPRLPHFLFSPVKAGEKAGWAEIYMDGELLARCELFYQEGIPFDEERL